jgi:hypothetical protein
MARIFTATLQSRYFGQLLINRFQFISSSDVNPVDGCQALANALGAVDTNGVVNGNPLPTGTLMGTLETLQVPALEYIAMEVITPYFPFGLFERIFPAGTAGNSAAGGDNLAPFIAVSIRSDRVRRDVRRGFKRFSGLTENEITATGLAPGALTELGNIADSISGTITGDAGPLNVAFQSAVVPLKRVPDSDPPQYELFENEGAAVSASAFPLEYEAEDKVTTQNSRKIGRGA